MGSYQGQATLVLTDDTRIEGQADVRASKHLWQGTIVVGPEDRDRAREATGIELPTGELRPISVNDTEVDAESGTCRVTFAG